MGWMLGVLCAAVVLLLVLIDRDRRRLQAERAQIARLLRRASDQPGGKAALKAVVEELMAAFGAREALLAIRDGRAARLHVWEFVRDAPTGELCARPLGTQYTGPAAYLVDTSERSVLARRQGRQDRIAGVTVDARGRRLAWDPPPGLLAGRAFRTALGASFGLQGDCSGRFWVLDPPRRRCSTADLGFLQAAVDQVAPALQGPYLRVGLKRRAGAAERARVAHELHDGVIQSLISLEMKVSVLRRNDGHASRTAEELEAIQLQLREDVLDLRELMTQMRPLDVAPHDFVEFVAEQVDRFSRDTSISATFISEVEDVRLPARTCSELARIVQEALVNVRKHSRARHVVIRLGLLNGSWKVTVDDDGRGFPFAGRLEQAALDASRKGPVVIKERVRSLGGALAIESHPDRGSRLEITVPS
jgi:signal transduction histidine kinase